jgi:hypothetical protein
VTSDATPSSEASSPATADEALAGFSARSRAIEEAYEFMLAYAAQGLPTEGGGAAGSQIREFLGKCDSALSGLAEALRRAVQRSSVQAPAPYEAFIGVVDADVQNAQAAVQLVLAQPSISSQMVDNLNASMHLRAVLTDLFLLGGVLKP